MGLFGWLLCCLLPTAGVEASFEMKVLPDPAGDQSGYADLWRHEDAVYMTWIESRGRSEGRIRLSILRGGSWSTPVTVHDSDRLFINWADTPRVARSGKLLIVAWPEKISAGTYAYGLRFARSFDDGAHFEEPRWLHEDTSPSEHGFVSFAALSDSRIGAVWLDGRAMTVDGDAHHGEGHMQLRYRIVAPDALAPEILVDPQTCECCGTALTSSGDRMWCAFRDKSDDQIRDIYLTSGKDGDWQTPAPVHEDRWEIFGCPVNGPTIASSGDTLAVAWFSAAKGAQSQLVVSSDLGKTFSSPIELGADTLGRLACTVLPSGKVAVAWLVGEDEGSHLRLGLFAREKDRLVSLGNKRLADTPAGRGAGFPRMVSQGEDVLLVFRDNMEPRLKVVRVATAFD